MRRAILLLLAACDEALDQRLSIVEDTRILAIVAEPAEVRPGDPVTYGALIASPDGPIRDPATWSYCIAGKPPTEDNVVAPPCLGEESIIPLGASLIVSAAIPDDACRVFGPEAPDVGYRPRDPDPSGGYFQPIRADYADARAFGLSRITCILPDAPAEIAHRYQLEYAANVAPGILPLQIFDGDRMVERDAVPANTTLRFVAGWPPDAAESYLYYDRATATLVTRRESLRVSWYATGGSFAVDASGIAEGAEATSVETTYRSPAAGTTWVWLVLRDSRGGLATETIELTVQ